MAKFSEETLSGWTYPPSDTEETKLSNTEMLIREALLDSDELKHKTIEVFGQGSYANDTNIRLNSDIDINVCLRSTFYFTLPEGSTREDFGYMSPTSYTFSEYKSSVERALIKKFGSSSVQRRNKCITVLGNTTRIKADVVPTWQYNRHDDKYTKHIGTKLYPDNLFIEVINYPKQHLENGKRKNAETQKRFKRLVRIVKRLKNHMKDNGVNVNDNITSFLIECLVWNVPNYIFNNNDTWTDRLREVITFLYNNTDDDSKCENWGEVSELLYLFHSSRKWNREQVNAFLLQSWRYLEF